MGREKKCILCRTICSTKQEMDEHMRSMLHHRELENLKGRDCDHECHVCRVSVVGLTGYANHISSSMHKHRVEQHDKGSKAADSEEEYFDQELVELIEKRRKLEDETKQDMEENQRKLQLQIKGISQHGGSIGYPIVPMMQKGYSSNNWGLHRGSPQQLTGGAYQDGKIPFSEGVGMWSHGRKFHPSDYHTGRSVKFQKWSTRGVGYRGGQRTQSDWNYEGQGCSPEQTEFSHPYMSHQDQGSWEWLTVTRSDLDFTNDQLPLSCRFDPSCVEEPSHGAYQHPGVYQNFQGRQQTLGKSRGMRGKWKGSKFGPSKQNRWTTYNWDNSEQDYEIMWKAKKALQNKDSLVTDPQTEVTDGKVTLGPKSNGQKPEFSTVEKSMKNKKIHPIKAGSYRKGKAALRKSCLMSTVQSVQISTSTGESPGEAQASGLEGQHSQEKELENVDNKGETYMATQAETMSMIEEMPILDTDEPKGAQAPGLGPAVPGLSKLDLPASLKRDLTRHMSKAVAHEPNLNTARRIRNIGESRKSEAEKDVGLRPNLRQLISSTGSRRSVNWEQVYHEVCKKKQEKGKGMPRFGIEMVPSVPSDPEVLNTEEEVSLSEGFHLESFGKPAVPGFGPRKRSFSESNLGATSPEEGPSAPFVKGCRVTEDRLSSSLWDSAISLSSKPGLEENKEQDKLCNRGLVGNSDNPIEEDTSIISGQEENNSKCTDLSVIKDNPSFGVANSEQNTEKKKEAKGMSPNGDFDSLYIRTFLQVFSCFLSCWCSPDVSSTGSFQVDQLLAVSLREEELNSSLQKLENSLIQARAALQSAYMEMQRLLMVKQQITTEMNGLRTKRIEILQGMQEGYVGEVKQAMKPSQVVLPAATASPSLPPSCAHQQDSLSYSPSQIPPAGLPHILHQAMPLSSMSPAHPTAATTVPVVIKEEPVSRKHLDSNPQADCTPNSSSTPLCLPRAEHHGSVVAPIGHSQENAPEGWGISGMQSCSGAQTKNERLQVTEKKCVSVSEKSCQKTFFTESEGENESHVQLAHTSSPDLPSQQSPPCSASLSKTKKVNLKKKWKMKKKQGKPESQVDSPQNSTIDQSSDTSIFFAMRKVKEKRSGICKSASKHKKQEKEEQKESRKESARGGQGLASPGVDLGASDSDSSSSLAFVGFPEAPPLDVVSLNSSDAEDEQETSGGEKCPSLCGATVPPDLGKATPKGLACNKVSSTSELNASTGRQNRSGLSPTNQSHCGANVSSEPTEGSFEGHTQAVTALQIYGNCLYTCSEDQTVRVFNLVTRQCIEVFEGHSAKVNCLLVSFGPDLQHRLYSGSSDQTIRCYSLKTHKCEEQFSLMDRVLCLHSRWKILYAGLANGCVVSFCLMSNRQLDVFECHGPRAVSCLASTQEGARRILLVGSYDCTISVRDAKSGLLLRTLKGHTKTVLCMKVVHEFVYSGSSDRSVQSYNIHTGELKRIYKGHNHAVTVVTVLGKVMITACLDKLVRVYELQSHDRLQVYGGHKDMIMCMAIHKSMIYTGCYDGTIQAVRLNLMQNYRCWWHGCTLIFGVVAHLHQHLLTDHTSPTFQVVKCRWKHCEAFFSVRNGTKKDFPEHMLRHAEKDSSPET
ncbi:zinc finger protein 106-like [Arapaima gigas]